MKRCIYTVLFFSLWVFSAGAKEVAFLGSFLDVPQGFEVISVRDDSFIFSAPEESGFLEGKWYPKKSFKTVEEFASSVMKELKASGEGDGFSCNGREAYLSDVSFLAGGNQFYGYAFFVALQEYWVVLLAFTTEDLFDAMNPYLVSAIDSFSADGSDLLSPGPMSQYLYPFPGHEPHAVKIQIGDERISFLFDEKELEVARDVVERETKIMGGYDDSPMGIEAWKRFYRMVYRDNYGRIELISRRVASVLGGVEDKRLFAERLLSWIQGFEYVQSGTLVISPIETLLTARGDCDSRSLLYTIILRQMGFDAVLLVSLDYSHALGAVDVPGSGARFGFEGKQYVVAETTDKVGLGLIERSMADPKGWIGVRLR